MVEQKSAAVVPARRKRWWRWAILLVIIASAAVWFARPRWQGVPVNVLAPTRGTVIETVVASGRVLAPSQAKVGASLIGVIERVAVEEGQAVARGDLLIELQDDEARAAVARAEATVAGIAAKRADLGKRRGPTAGELLKQARSNLAQAEVDHARNSALAKDGALPEADLRRSQTNLELARSRVRAAEIEARAARPDGSEDVALDAQEADAKASLEAAQARLALHTLSSPIDGIVLHRDVEVGNVVQPGVPLLVLAEAGQDRLVIEPDEKNLRVLALGQPAKACPCP